MFECSHLLSPNMKRRLLEYTYNCVDPTTFKDGEMKRAYRKRTSAELPGRRRVQLLVAQMEETDS
jgi:hypothetical protein